MQAAVLAVSATCYQWLGLSVAWATFPPNLILVSILLAVWGYFYYLPGRANEWILAESAFILFLFLLFGSIGPPAQYVAVALNRPLVDPWLAAGDAHMGVNVPALTAWTRTHPLIANVLRHAYVTLLPQFFLPIVILGPVLRNRRHMWEYAFHFHFCSLVTLAALALFPAECPFTYYGYECLVNMARFIRHFHGFRDGTLTVIRFDDIEGLISFPSFHVAGAVMVTWAFRRHRWFFIPLLGLNAALTAATVMLGIHYAIDTVATAVMFAGSLIIHRRRGERLVTVADRVT